MIHLQLWTCIKSPKCNYDMLIIQLYFMLHANCIVIIILSSATKQVKLKIISYKKYTQLLCYIYKVIHIDEIVLLVVSISMGKP